MRDHPRDMHIVPHLIRMGISAHQAHDQLIHPTLFEIDRQKLVTCTDLSLSPSPCIHQLIE